MYTFRPCASTTVSRSRVMGFKGHAVLQARAAPARDKDAQTVIGQVLLL